MSAKSKAAIRAREQAKLNPEKPVKRRVREAATEAKHTAKVREEAAEQGGLGKVTTADLP